MALQGLVSTFTVAAPPRMSPPLARNHTKTRPNTQSVKCIATPTTTIDQDAAPRRNANYPPSFWDYGFVKSLSSDYGVRILINITYVLNIHLTFLLAPHGHPCDSNKKAYKSVMLPLLALLNY